MSGRLSFRSRILLSFVLVTILALLAPAWYLRTIFIERLADTGRDEALTILNYAMQELRAAQGMDDRDGLQRKVSFLSNETGARITYLGPNGQALADSWPATLHERRSFERLSEQSTLADEALIENEIIAVSRPAPRETGLPAGFVRVALAKNSFQQHMDRLALGMGLSFVVALVLALLLGLILARRLGESWKEIISVAEAIGKGKYTRRLSLYGSKDYDALARSINAMADRIESHIKTMTLQKSRLEAILNGMNEGVMVLDASGRIRSMNKALKDIFPDAEHGEGRRPLEVIMSPQLQKACDALLEQAADSKRSTEEGAPSMSLQIEPAKDNVYDVNLVGLMAEQEGLGVVAVFHDISRLSKLERVRRDFVANVSHELRTPLTSIKGYAETLVVSVEEGCAKPEAHKSFVEVILKNANHMAKMVDDLMHLARLESGRKPFDIQPASAAEALAQAVKECSHLMAERQVELNAPLDEDDNLVLADFDRLVQVFRNLVENAAKYGEEGGTVTIWRERKDGKALFAVHDTGPGIPREERERIFERFYRVDKHRGGKDRGGSSGLGLAITKHIVEKLGGRIWVESPAPGNADGKGAVFYFTLPLADQEPETG